jgi:glutamine synthetase
MITVQENLMTTEAQITDPVRWLDAHPEVESVMVAICDLNGGTRGNRLPVSQAGKAFRGGLRMPLSALGVDIWGADVLGNSLVFDTGDSDGILEPTERGLLPVTWGARPSAMLPLWMAAEDGAPFPGDPRRALAAITARFAELGLTPVVASELEFYLVDPSGAHPRPPISPATGQRLSFDNIYSVDELDAFAPFLEDVYAACACQGVPADAAISENGCGQFEINLLHDADPLRAADDAVLFKRIAKGVARKHGFAASFMAKPYGDRSGNGLHIHFSLLDGDGNNVFDDGTEQGSDTLRHAVAGLIAAMPETTLLFAPHLNSYRRIRPGTHAPASAAWGYENRTTAIRIPGGPTVARRIEHRVAGADANPYLVIAGILGAALHGIEAGMTPPDPVIGNAYSAKLPPLPYDWASALAAFEQGALVPMFLDPILSKLLSACKHQEMTAFAERVTDFEYASYLETV